MADNLIEQVQMTAPRAYVFGMMMQKKTHKGLEVTPALVIVNKAISADEALGEAFRKAQRQVPGASVVDWACAEVLAPLPV